MLWKLASWNVNGLRAVVRKKLFVPVLESFKPDLLSLQEIKIDGAAKDEAEFDFLKYHEYWNHAAKSGYSGTATFLREDARKPISVSTGIGIEKFDSEGRVQTFEFDKFYYVNTYFPHTRHDLSRLDFKLEFNEAILKYLKKLDKNLWELRPGNI